MIALSCAFIVKGGDLRFCFRESGSDSDRNAFEYLTEKMDMPSKYLRAGIKKD